MTANARDAYLTTQVMTATPQKLQLLLIDAAIRSIQLSSRFWEEGNEEAAGDALTHAEEVLSELLASVGSARSEISRRLASLYMFLFRTLTEAHLQHDAKKLADVLRILLIERETWSQVCEKFGTTQSADQKPSNASEASLPETSVESTPSSSAAQTGFDSSRMVPSPTPQRRAMPVAFPANQAGSSSSGISFQA